MPSTFLRFSWLLLLSTFILAGLSAQCQTEFELVNVNCGFAPSTVFIGVQVASPGSNAAVGWSPGDQTIVYPFDTLVDLGGFEGAEIVLEGRIVGDANCQLIPLRFTNPCFDSTTCPLELIIASATPADCGASNGSITFEVNNVAPPFVIEYTGPGGSGRLENTLELSGALAGTYVFELIDATDFCTTTLEYTLANNSDLEAEIGVVPGGCGEAVLVAEAVSGGTPPYTYAWSTGETTESIVATQSGFYQLEVGDAAGCTFTATTQVLVNDALFLFPDSLSVIDASCGLANGSIFPTPSGGVRPYAYQWSNGATTSNLFGLAPGAYGLTVTDQEGCTVSEEYTVGENGELPIFPFPENPVLCGPGSSTRIGVELGVDGADIVWRDEAGNVLSNTFDLEVTEPGDYTVTVSIGDCQEERTVTVSRDSDGGEDYRITRFFVDDSVGGSCGPVLAFGDLIFNPVEWVVPDGRTFFSGSVNAATYGPGLYIAQIAFPNTGFNCTFTDSTIVLPEELTCGSLSGRVFLDRDGGCTFDADEFYLEGQLVEINGSGNDQRQYYAYTDTGGVWSANVPPGNYTIRVISPNDILLPCEDNAVYEVQENQSTLTANLGLIASEFCPRVTVDLNIPLIRRCFDNPVYLSYANSGTAPAEDVVITVKVEAFADEVTPFFEPAPSSIVFDQNTGTYLVSWSIGNLPPFAEGRLGFLVYTCNADAPLGTAACISATAEPNNPCPPASALWSGASVRVNGECQGDSVVFRLRNVGDAAMTAPLSYVVVEDGVILNPTPEIGDPLGVGEEMLVNLPADGATYHVRADQEPFHPGLQMPIDFVEGCGGAPGSIGFALQFPVSDDAFWIDEDCLPIIGSYDPNDKQTEPRGYGDEFFIEADQPLDYLIRFQNTGTDTAFRVVIRDTLSEQLDLSTFELLSSTHRVATKFDSLRGISFIFDDILLVDSFTNEPASHGAVSFRIRPRAGVSPGTVIPNTASIYFDFNEPIVTNTTRHTVEKGFVIVGLLDFSPDLERLRVYPNPTAGPARIQLPPALTGEDLELEVFDGLGRKMRSFRYGAGRSPDLELGDLPPGMYTIRLSQNHVPVGSGRLLLERN